MNEKSLSANLDTLIEEDTQVIFQTSTVFPFDFFPKQVVVYLNRIDIVNKIFFFTNEVQSILVKDIYTVHAQSNPFFGSISIVNRQITIPEVSISKLSASDTARLRKIIQGLIMASEHDATLRSLNPQELLPKLEELGETQGVEAL